MIPYRVGALVNSSITEPLVTVSDDSEVYAYFSMTENQILDFVQQYGSLKKAIENMDEVELTMSNGKTYSHVGKVDAISGTVVLLGCGLFLSTPTSSCVTVEVVKSLFLP